MALSANQRDMSGCGDVSVPIKNCFESQTKINLTREDKKQSNLFYAGFFFIMLIISHSDPTIAGTSHESGGFFSYCPTFFFNVLLTVHLSIILVTDQLKAQILVL